jgi:NAD(P)-dependent dehydrogenase (short-subunit alcohol dehydrogenase family)
MTTKALNPHVITDDGIEITACNATGPFALTMHLLPILKSTAKLPDSHVRIVTVSSDQQDNAVAFDFSSLEGLNSAKPGTMGRYANSKLAVSGLLR